MAGTSSRTATASSRGVVGNKLQAKPRPEEHEPHRRRPSAGPVGGTASLDTQPAILSYVRTKCLFAGLNLEGARMGFAPKINAEHYGAEVSAREILWGSLPAPASLAVFQQTLATYAAETDAASSAATSPYSWAPGPGFPRKAEQRGPVR
ncbi:MAG: YSC84-related protein [Thermoanaerobaculia bacterium]